MYAYHIDDKAVELERERQRKRLVDDELQSVLARMAKLKADEEEDTATAMATLQAGTSI